jgi:hypothetical protein
MMVQVQAMAMVCLRERMERMFLQYVSVSVSVPRRSCDVVTLVKWVCDSGS